MDLSALFLTKEVGWAPEGACQHIEWLRQRPFISVDEWLGDDGRNGD